MITIGQLAAYAGVTVKAVRHYHSRGLLPEPPRDRSGYRRYDAGHAVRLLKIATLAQAGVPLARVQELLAARPEEFGEAILAIDREVAERISDLQRTRRRLMNLRRSSDAFVSPDAARYLERLRTLGVSERGLRLERDTWIVLQAIDPDLAHEIAASKLRQLEDPEFGAITLAYDQILDAPPDDPRIEPLARRTATWLASRPDESDPTWRTAEGAEVARQLLATATQSSPAWDRVAELIAEISAGHTAGHPAEHTAEPAAEPAARTVGGGSGHPG